MPLSLRTVQQLGQVADHDVGAVRPQCVGLSRPIHAHHEPEPAGPAGRHAGERVLEHRGLRRLDSAQRAPARNESGAGLPFSPCAAIARPSIQPSTSVASPVTRRTSAVLALEDTTTRRRPASRAASRYRREPSNTSTPSSRIRRSSASFLRFARPLTVSRSGLSSGFPSGRVMPRLARKSRTPSGARLAVDVGVVVGHRVERNEGLARPLGPLPQEERRTSPVHALSCTAAVSVSTPSRSNRPAVTASGSPSRPALARPTSAPASPVTSCLHVRTLTLHVVS